MTIRRAEERDVPRLLELLAQVLAIHAAIRPDIFVPGSTKYTEAELRAIVADDGAPVFVADDCGVAGYAFCAIREQKSNHLAKRRTLYIDDLCVDSAKRGAGIGEALFRFVCGEARRLGCADVTLAVWEGNDGARRFYEKMGMKPKETIMELSL